MTPGLAPSRSAVDAFFTTFIERRKAHSFYYRQIARKTGLSFNVCDLILYEAQISDVFRDLLDPMGSHGQGDDFLRSFLEQLGDIPIKRALVRGLGSDHPPISIRREEVTGTGKFIDLVVDARDGVLGIENKPWANHQPGQLADYAHHLQETARDRCWALVYIGDATVPSTSLPKERRNDLVASKNYVELSYAQEISTWLKICWRSCDADRVRWFLQDLSEHLSNHFPHREMGGNQC
jgi:hypothetical protein